VVFIIGFTGLMRINELVSLSFSDVVIKEEQIEVTIKKSKTSNSPYVFLITEKKYINLIKEYLKIIPTEVKELLNNRFFKTIRNGIMVKYLGTLGNIGFFFLIIKNNLKFYFLKKNLLINNLLINNLLII
jgi:integrase